MDYWKYEGRVMLEYGCPVWHSGLTYAHSHSLDRAQRTAMAAITGRWKPSHTKQLQDLGLERLSTRRIRLCKTFAKRTATNSRHMDMLTPVTIARRLGTYREIPEQGHITSLHIHIGQTTQDGESQKMSRTFHNFDSLLRTFVITQGFFYAL